MALIAGAQVASVPETSALALTARWMPVPVLPFAAAVRPVPPLPPAPPAPAPTPSEIRDAQLRAIREKGESRTLGLPYRHGRLRNPARLPLEGSGYCALRPERDRYYGTDDMVAAIIEVAAALQAADPAIKPLAVADIAGPRGGKITGHISHQSGRDADLVFFWMDDAGRPVVAADLVRFNGRGRGRYEGKRIRFDVARNWALVRGFLSDRRLEERVAVIFVYRPLRELLLRYAERHESDRRLVQQARWLLRAPGSRDGLHDDHFHIRLSCSRREAELGCRD